MRGITRPGQARTSVGFGNTWRLAKLVDSEWSNTGVSRLSSQGCVFKAMRSVDEHVRAQAPGSNLWEDLCRAAERAHCLNTPQAVTTAASCCGLPRRTWLRR